MSCDDDYTSNLVNSNTNSNYYGLHLYASEQLLRPREKNSKISSRRKGEQRK